MNNDAFELTRYTNELLTLFNNKHKTKFSCILGLNTDIEITSEAVIDAPKRLYQMRIYLPKDSVSRYKSEEFIEALKILIAMEMSKHLYLNMTNKSWQTAKMCLNAAAGNYKRLMLSYCIEVAADLHGQQLYLGHKYNNLDIQNKEIPREIYREYNNLLCGNSKVKVSKVEEDLKLGYMTSVSRVRIMMKHKSFKYDNYAIINDITDEVNKAYEKCNNAKNRNRPSLITKEYLSWMTIQLNLQNFPNEVNKIRSVVRES